MPMPRCSLSASKCSLRGLIDRRSGGTSVPALFGAVSSLIRRALAARTVKSIGRRRSLRRGLPRLVEVAALAGHFLLGRAARPVEIALAGLDLVRCAAG